MEPWDLYDMQRNTHGIQFEFVRPPFGRDMEDEYWDDDDADFEGPMDDGEMYEDAEEVADNMHDGVVQRRGNVRGRDDAGMDDDVVHRRQGVRRQRVDAIPAALPVRRQKNIVNNARPSYPRRQPPPPPTNPQPVPAASATNFANHTQGTRDKKRNARLPNPAGLVSYLNGKRKGGD